MQTPQSSAAAEAVPPPKTDVDAASAGSRPVADEHPSQPSEPQLAQQQQQEQAGLSPATEVPLNQEAEQERQPAAAAAAEQSPLPSQPPPAPAHRLKRVQLPGGRAVPVVMQSENGPCPLLAIANVLLLRGNISLPAGASEVTQVLLQSQPPYEPYHSYNYSSIFATRPRLGHRKKGSQTSVTTAVVMRCSGRATCCRLLHFHWARYCIPCSASMACHD